MGAKKAELTANPVFTTYQFSGGEPVSLRRSTCSQLPPDLKETTRSCALEGSDETFYSSQLIKSEVYNHGAGEGRKNVVCITLQCDLSHIQSFFNGAYA